MPPARSPCSSSACAVTRWPSGSSSAGGGAAVRRRGGHRGVSVCDEDQIAADRALGRRHRFRQRRRRSRTRRRRDANRSRRRRRAVVEARRAVRAAPCPATPARRRPDPRPCSSRDGCGSSPSARHCRSSARSRRRGVPRRSSTDPARHRRRVRDSAGRFRAPVRSAAARCRGTPVRPPAAPGQPAPSAAFRRTSPARAARPASASRSRQPGNSSPSFSSGGARRVGVPGRGHPVEVESAGSGGHRRARACAPASRASSR